MLIGQRWSGAFIAAPHICDYAWHIVSWMDNQKRNEKSIFLGTLVFYSFVATDSFFKSILSVIVFLLVSETIALTVYQGHILSVEIWVPKGTKEYW